MLIILDGCFVALRSLQDIHQVFACLSVCFCLSAPVCLKCLPVFVCVCVCVCVRARARPSLSLDLMQLIVICPSLFKLSVLLAYEKASPANSDSLLTQGFRCMQCCFDRGCTRDCIDLILLDCRVHHYSWHGPMAFLSTPFTKVFTNS